MKEGIVQIGISMDIVLQQFNYSMPSIPNCSISKLLFEVRLS